MHRMSFGSRALPGPARGAYSAPQTSSYTDPRSSAPRLMPSAFGDRVFRFFFPHSNTPENSALQCRFSNITNCPIFSTCFHRCCQKFCCMAALIATVPSAVRHIKEYGAWGGVKPLPENIWALSSGNTFWCIYNKKLIRRWDSERELSLRRHCTRTKNTIDSSDGTIQP